MRKTMQISHVFIWPLLTDSGVSQHYENLDSFK